MSTFIPRNKIVNHNKISKMNVSMFNNSLMAIINHFHLQFNDLHLLKIFVQNKNILNQRTLRRIVLRKA